MIESINCQIDQKLNKLLIIRFKLCSNIITVDYKKALSLFELSYSLYKTAMNNYKNKHKLECFKPFSYKEVMKFMYFTSKGRYMLNTMQGQCKLYEQMQERDIKENNKKISFTPKNINVFTRLTEIDTEFIKEDFNDIKTLRRSSYVSKMPETMVQVIDKCLHKILPKTPTIYATIAKRNSKKVLEIDKKEKNEKQLHKTLEILQESKFHKNPNIRGYVCQLIKEFSKDQN